MTVTRVIRPAERSRPALPFRRVTVLVRGRESECGLG